MENQDEKIITAKHSMACGDMISIMAGMKAHYERTGEKWLVYQVIGLPGIYYEGAVYSTKSETGVPVTMNEDLFRMLRPLLVAQEYIEDFRIYQQQKIDVDFDVMFKMGICNKPWGMIQRWPFYCYWNLALDCDLSQPWLKLPEVSGCIYEQMQDKILVNRTERYNNSRVSYEFLNEYAGSVVFTGTKREVEKFSADWKFQDGYLQVDDFYQLAQYIYSCKVFVGNQSLCWNIAEALKVPRVLEVFKEAPNCIPVGKDAYDAMDTTAMKNYVEYLWNKK